MKKEQIDKQTTELSDTQLLGAALTSPKDASEMMTALIAAVEADPTADYSDLGMALRAALNKQFNPIIQSDDFQAYLAKNIPLVKTSQDIKSADALIDFVISLQATKGKTAQSIIDKELPKIALRLNTFGDLQVLENNLKQLNEKLKELKEDGPRANSEVKRLVTRFIKLTPIMTAGLYRTQKEVDAVEDLKTKAMGITDEITTKDLADIKEALFGMNTFIPNEELSLKYFVPLEMAIIARDTLAPRSKFYDKEIFETSKKIITTKKDLAEEHIEDSDKATYTKSLESILKLTVLTCKSPKEAASSPTYQIQDLKGNNPQLEQTIEVTSTHYQELKQKGKLPDEDPVPTSNPEALKQHFTGKVSQIKKEIQTFEALRPEARGKRAERIKNLLPQKYEEKQNLEQEITDLTKDIAATTIQKMARKHIAINKVNAARIKPKTTIIQKIMGILARLIETIQSFLLPKNNSEQPKPEDEIQNPMHPRESESLEHTEENPEQKLTKLDDINQNEDRDSDGEGAGDKGERDGGTQLTN